MTSYLQSLAVTADLYDPKVCVRILRVSGLGPVDEGRSEVMNHLSGDLRPDTDSTGKGLRTGRNTTYKLNPTAVTRSQLAVLWALFPGCYTA